MDAVEVLKISGGAASWSALAGAGVSRTGLQRAVERGAVHRLAADLCATPGTPAPEVARAALGGDRVALGCGDGARELGLTVLLLDDRVHLVAARGSSATCPGTVVHRSGLNRGRRCMDPGTTLLAAPRCMGLVVVVSLVDQALARGLVSPGSLQRLGVRTDAAWRRALALADRRSGSAMESCARVPLVVASAHIGVRVDTQVRLSGVGRTPSWTGGSSSSLTASHTTATGPDTGVTASATRS